MDKIQIIQMVSTLLIIGCSFLALYFIFHKDSPKIDIKKGYKTIDQMINSRLSDITDEKKQSYYIDKITKKKKPLVERIKESLIEKIYSEYSNFTMLGYIFMTIVFVIIGLLVTYPLNNPAMSILIMIVSAIVPYIVISTINRKRCDYQNRKLLLVMGNLGTAITRTNTFIEAVEQTLDIIPEGLIEKFKHFYNSVTFLGEEKIDAMVTLRDSIKNDYFYKFMNLCIAAELGEKSLKNTIQSIPTDYKRDLDINEKYQNQMKENNANFLLVLCCFPGVLGFLKASSDYYFNIITQTMVGKITLVIITLILIGISAIFVQLNKPPKIKL
ncbi:hypothetical protein SAMN02745120_0140 [Acetoanaerobium noterae]|uniref:Tight adherence protein B n=1 Tax=Acetoanaerobium noterae TaxID=745369 RepID=A0A1T5DTQ1_9FIRM|nr:hypothetical protein [Acetoanaerobium noterae]SKB74910.1 hypothetical protein SAMN02745120_0140 [Acetoanaerobium noterae]